MNFEHHLRTEGDINLSEERQAWSQNQTDYSTQTLLQRDADVFLHQALSTPCLDVITSSEGIYIKNEVGKSYMDFHGNNVHQLGYGNSYIIDRVKQQLDQLAFCPRRFTNESSVTLAERLVGLTDHSLQRVLFAPGGTSAISIALKIARYYTGKYKTVAMYDAFHGASMDSISMGGEYVFQQGLGPLLVGSIHVPPVDTYRGMWYKADQEDPDMAYADYLAYVFEKEGDIGALVMETVRSTVVHVHSKAFWKRVRELCDAHQVLLILDEIPTGMGRTGKMFAYQDTGIEPDILVLGKGLGAGIVPLAAVLCKEKFNIASSISLGHFTHEKSPLAASAAIAALDFMQEQRLLERTKSLEQIISVRLDEMKGKLPCIGDVRGLGLLWAVELVEDRERKVKAISLASKVLYYCLENGLSIKVSDGNVLSLYPPLIISEEELNTALQILENAITEFSNPINKADEKAI